MRFFLLLCFIPLLACAAEERVVFIGTESKLKPLYLTAMDGEKADYGRDYLQKLSDILRFDLSHNGMTQVLTESEGLSKLALGKTIDYLSWQEKKIPFLVVPQVEKQKLSARVVALYEGKTTPIQGLSLTGNLQDDRKAMHKLADLVHKVFFGREGIASVKFLYATTYKGIGKETGEVYESDYDGANIKQLTHEQALCVHPSYVPEEQGLPPEEFLFVSYRLGQPKIYVASLKDGKGERLLSVRGNQFMPVLNRAKDKLAFVCDVAGNPDLFVQSLDNAQGLLGKPRQIFTAPRGTQASPSFSPDGKRVAFVSNKDGFPRIYVLPIPPAGADIRSLKPQLLSKKNRENTSPSWSPDGSKIAYSSMTSGTRQIWMYDFLSEEEIQLTSGPGHKENPSFAPDSLHLLYNTAAEDSGEIYLMNLNQPGAVKLTSGPGLKRFPCWQPKVL